MHSLIIGTTESGKTTLGKRLAASHMINGKQVAVLTPIFEDWGTENIFSDQDQFLDFYWKNTSLYVFVDEGGETVGRYNDVMARIATQGRHLGHSNYFIAQRATMISPNVRGMTSRLFLFATGRKDCQLLAEEWRADELLEASNLQKGEFISVSRFKNGEKDRVSRGFIF